MVPYYNKPPQEGMYQHFKSIAGKTNLPCIVYNIMGRTGVNMTDETTIRLSQIDNIVGTKEASGDLVYECPGGLETRPYVSVRRRRAGLSRIAPAICRFGPPPFR